MAIQARHQFVFFTSEAAAGVRPAAGAGWTALPFALALPSVERQKAIREDDINGRGVPEPGSYAGSMASITLECPLFPIVAERAGANAAAVDCPLDALLAACGWEAAGGGGDDEREYTLISPGAAFAAYPSASIVWSAGGVWTEMLACRGSMTISFEAGREARASFEMRGVVASDYETAPAAYDAIKNAATKRTAADLPAPPSARGASLTLADDAAVNQLDGALGATLAVEQGANVEQSPDISAAEGYAAPVITNFTPKINTQIFMAKRAADQNILGAAAVREDGLYQFTADFPAARGRGGLNISASVQAASASQEESGGILRDALELSVVMPSDPDDAPLTMTMAAVAPGAGGNAGGRSRAPAGGDGAAGGQGGAKK